MNYRTYYRNKNGKFAKRPQIEYYRKKVYSMSKKRTILYCFISPKLLFGKTKCCYAHTIYCYDYEICGDYRNCVIYNQIYKV